MKYREKQRKQKKRGDSCESPPDTNILDTEFWKDIVFGTLKHIPIRDLPYKINNWKEYENEKEYRS